MKRTAFLFLTIILPIISLSSCTPTDNDDNGVWDWEVSGVVYLHGEPCKGASVSISFDGAKCVTGKDGQYVLYGTLVEGQKDKSTIIFCFWPGDTGYQGLPYVDGQQSITINRARHQYHVDFSR